MSQTRRSSVLSRLRAFARAQSGGIVMAFALGAPALALVVAGGIDLYSVSTDKDAIQAAADSAALNVATQLKMSTPAGIQGRVQQLVDNDLAPIASRFTYTVTATADQQSQNLDVVIAGKRDSFFANLLPPGGWDIRVQTSAQSMGQIPLCVLSKGTAILDRINMLGGRMVANGCLIFSDSQIIVAPTASLQAAAVQSVSLATGPISPAPEIGAAPIPDPFASMTIAPPTSCASGQSIDVAVSIVLPAGNHCGNIIVHNGATLTLAPGEHYFLKGKLDLKDTSKLTGVDVVMIFDQQSDFRFGGNSTVVIDGRKTGPYAGFVIATTTANTGVFEISSDNAKELLGTIYIPSAQLLISGTANKVNDQAAWTVIVSKSINFTGNPQLIINSNYAGSSVPVPQGVGPSTVKGVKLVH